MSVTITPSVKITIAFEGKEYTCTKPKLGAAIAFEEAVEKARKKGGSGATQLIADHLQSCGLPADVVKELDADQIEQVMAVLQSQKKS